MKSYVIFSAALLAALCVRAAEPTTESVKVPPIFVPVVSYYTNGNFVKSLVVGDEWFSTLKECQTSLSMGLLQVMENHKMPEGGGMVGACMPAPSMLLKK